MFDRLKTRWGITSTWSLFAIILAFSLAGMAILPARKLIFHLLHYGSQTPFWLKFITWLAIVFPTYQIALLIFGTLLGEFRFFWEKEKKLGRWIADRFRCERGLQQG